ncbi:hypothetical protein ACGFYU_17970 [Streptomyces sp. NPDC048337]|uniref:hypothetical protein n=1 Tax=Streptomyces sp. NPDC048337 TaxID=3365535 RepID=UPI0037115924
MPVGSASANGGTWRCDNWNDGRRWDDCCNRDWRYVPDWCWDNGRVGGVGGYRDDWRNWNDSNWNWNWNDSGRGGDGNWNWNDSGRGGDGNWNWNDSGRGGNGDWGNGDWGNGARGGGNWGG